MNKMINIIIILMISVTGIIGQTYTTFSSDNSDLPYNDVYCITFDNDGNIWFGGQRDASTGLANVSMLSADLSAWTVYPASDANLGLGNLEDRVFYLAVDDQNTKWFCTHYGVSYLKADGTSGVVGFTDQAYTRSVLTDMNGSVYISQREDARADARIHVSDDNGTTWNQWALSDIGSPLSQDDARPELYDIGYDSQGNFWCCTWYGVSYRDPQGVWHSIEETENLYTYAMAIDPYDNVWVTDRSDNFLYQITPDDFVTHDANTIPPLANAINDLASDQYGHLYCAMDGGGILEIFPGLGKTNNAAAVTYKEYTNANTGGGLPDDNLSQLEILNDDIWISSPAGITQVTDLVRLSTDEKGSQPRSFQLFDNQPNPFNPTTNIRFELMTDDLVEMNIYDLTGNLIKNVTNDHYTVGTHSLNWNGLDNSGRQVPSGIYIYNIKTSNHSESKKMMLLK